MVIASFLSPEMEDTVATWIALFVLFVVPVVLIALFWMVHILPEKIAHQRHHPQFEAIRTLCLLSLVFGGLLWPIAWIWAYSKPVIHKIAYGTDKASHDVEEEGSAWDEHAKPAAASALPAAPAGLHDRLARLEAAGLPGDDLKAIRASIEALEAKASKQGA
jgi:CBS domain containing-hemolysin-like protein